MEDRTAAVNSSETPCAEGLNGPQPPGQLDGDGLQDDADDHNSAETASWDRGKEILKVLEAVERDSAAISESFSSLFASLRVSLSQVTSSTVEHMNCFSDAAGRLQECVVETPSFLRHRFFHVLHHMLDASTKGNRYVNSCLRLNEEMKGMETLANQLKILRRHVDALDSAVNRSIRFP